MAAASGFSDEIKKRLADAVFLNDDWNEIDRGVLTKEELLARFIENDPGIEKEIYMEENSNVIDATKLLEAGKYMDKLKGHLTNPKDFSKKY